MYGPSDAGQAIFVKTRAALMVPVEIPRSPLLEIASFHQLTHCRLQQNAVASRANDGLHCLLEALGEEEEGEEFAVEFLW